MQMSPFARMRSIFGEWHDFEMGRFERGKHELQLVVGRVTEERLCLYNLCNILLEFF